MKRLSGGRGCLGCFGIIFALGMVLFIVSIFATEKFIEDTTGFEIPFFRESFSTRPTDVGVAAILRVSPEKARALIQDSNFLPCKKDPSKSIFFGLFSEKMILSDPFPPKDELVRLQGASKWKSWGIFAHEASGRFWIVVLHPDMAGDSPPGALGE